MPTFEARKARSLAALSDPGPDKSPKGGLDAPIEGLVTWLNAQRDVCTTSSCSGRVSLFAHAAGRAKGGTWAYISHERAAAADVAAALASVTAAAGTAEADAAGDVVLRFEPFILTAECATREAGLAVRRRAQRRRSRSRTHHTRRRP
jgi:tRNA wybutosine-synthesizing protein 3